MDTVSDTKWRPCQDRLDQLTITNISERGYKQKQHFEKMGPKLKESNKSIQQLEIKHTILDTLKEQVSTTLTSSNVRRVKRLKNQLQEKSDECFNLVSKITELKLAEGEDSIDVNEWNREEENKIRYCDDLMDDLDGYINDQQTREKQEASHREYKMEEGDK